MNLQPRSEQPTPETILNMSNFGPHLSARPFDGVTYLSNPSQAELRALALKHTPAILETAVGSINKLTRNKARMAKYTYVISDGAHVLQASLQTPPIAESQPNADD